MHGADRPLLAHLLREVLVPELWCLKNSVIRLDQLHSTTTFRPNNFQNGEPHPYRVRFRQSITNKSSLHVDLIDTPILCDRYGHEEAHEFDSCHRRVELSSVDRIGMKISEPDQTFLKASGASCESLLSLTITAGGRGGTTGGVRLGFHVPFLVSVENAPPIALSHPYRSVLSSASRTDVSSLEVIASGDTAAL